MCEFVFCIFYIYWLFLYLYVVYTLIILVIFGSHFLHYSINVVLEETQPQTQTNTHTLLIHIDMLKSIK